MKFDGKGYRADIDGLRSVAVLLVVFFHLNKDLLPGGFLGIDIFFVISGFLITRNIVNEREQGEFSFSSFYIRRLRRLFPAHIATLLVTVLFATLILAPLHLKEFGQSLVAVCLFVGNIFFSAVAGYFDGDVYNRPLLHMWSLSVEEQYYLIWPLCVVVFLRFFSHRMGFLASLLVVLFSVMFAQALLAVDGGVAYYWLPARMFEFCCGAMLVWLLPYNNCARYVHEVLFLMGGALIIFCAFSYSGEMELPGMLTLLPVLGAMLLIYSGGKALILPKLLSSSAMVAGGKISYSLYLVHWPLIVFYKYHTLSETLSLPEMLGLFVATVVLAVVLYRVIELPFRYPRAISRDCWGWKEHKAFIYGGVLLTLCVAYAGVWLYKSNGWESRVPEEYRMVLERGTKYHPGRKEVIACFVQSHNLTFEDFLDKEECYQLDPARRNYAVVGDSVAFESLHGLRKTFPEINFIQFATPQCRPVLDENFDVYDSKQKRFDTCEKLMQYVFHDFLVKNKVDKVIIMSLAVTTNERFIPYLFLTAEYLKSIGQKPMIIPVPISLKKGLPIILHSYAKEIYRGSGENVDEFVAPYFRTYWMKKMNNLIAERAEQDGVAYVLSYDLMCPNDKCKIFYRGAPVIWDGFHFTAEGAEYFAEQIRIHVPGFLE